jgi:ATP-binding protein involved in chromosome partitioning
MTGNNEKELEQAVLEALRKVNDPELHRSIVEIGMVKNLVVKNGDVSFDIVLTTTACPLKAQIQKEATEAAQSVEGVKEVKANISGETLAPKVPKKNPIPGIKNIIAVSSGKGGVGKTTVSVNLACALKKRGASVGILDADIYGPNVPLMMGLKNAVINQKTPEGKMKPPENYDVKVMSMAFLVKDEQPVVWRGPLLDRVIRQFFSDTGWGELDYLIVDLPPGTGDAQLTIIEAVPVVGAVIVTTPQDVAILDSKKGLSMFKNAGIPVLGVIENMSHYVCTHCGEKAALFGEGGGKYLAELLDVPYLGDVPMNPQVRKFADEGQPIVVAEPESIQAEAFLNIAHQLTTTICELGVDELLAATPA